MATMFRAMLVLCLALCAGGAHAQAQVPMNPADVPREVLLQEGQFEKAPTIPPWIDMSPSIPKPSEGGPFALLLADAQFLATSNPVVFHRRAWTASTNTALDQLGRASMEFYPAFQRARWHVLRVIRDGVASDRLPQARFTFMQRETSLVQNVYTGVTTVNTILEDVRAGDVVEMAFSIEGVNPVFAGKYHANSLWDQSVKTELRRLSLMHPPERPIQWKVVGDSPLTTVPEPEVSTAQGMRKLQWTARELARTPIEPMPPPGYVGFKFLQFSEFRDWSDVAAWGLALFQAAPADTTELDARVAEFKAKPNQAARAAAAIHWVQENIRYVSISIGESSHRPAQPDVTLRRRYGDCKDKSALLTYFLQRLGIDAWPVLMAARSPQLPARTLPSPGAFDHAIVRLDVDGVSYFVDPTRYGQGTNLLTLGSSWAEAQVFELRPGNDKVTAIPPARPKANRDEIVERFRVASLNGAAELDVTQVWTGSTAETMRVTLGALPKEPMTKAVLTSYVQRYPGIEMVSPPAVTDDREANVLTMTFRLKGARMVTKQGDNWVLRLAGSPMATVAPLPAEGRVAPVALTRYGVDLRYTAEAEFPPEVSAGRSPRAVTVKDDGFTTSVNESFRGNLVSRTVDLVVHQPSVAPKQFKAYSDHTRQLQALPAFFFVTSGEVKKTASASLREAAEQRARNTVINTTRNIDTGKLGGDELVAALCARTSARAALQQFDEALNDGQAAVRANPDSAVAHRCRGFAQFVKGNYEEAIADYSEAIARSERPTRYYFDRGRARMYAGRLGEAADDFRKAGIDAPGEASEKLYAEIWHVFTALKAGRPLPPASAQLAAASPRGDWPRPAIAMLHGLISVEEMYATLKDRAGDGRSMNMLEADFYAGELYLIRGDREKAAESFRKAIAYGGISFNEHHDAAMELGKLEGK